MATDFDITLYDMDRAATKMNESEHTGIEVKAMNEYGVARSKLLDLEPSAAARMLGVSDTTLAKWRMRRFGPKFRRIGRRVFYSSTDVMQWIENQAVESATST